jgi:hypothetical protein
MTLKASKEGARKDMSSNSALFNAKSLLYTKVLVQKETLATSDCSILMRSR